MNSAGGFRGRLDDFEERLNGYKERLDDSWKDNMEIPSGACKTYLIGHYFHGPYLHPEDPSVRN